MMSNHLDDSLSWLYSSSNTISPSVILPSTGRTNERTRKATAEPLGDTARVLALDDAENDNLLSLSVDSMSESTQNPQNTAISPSVLALMNPSLPTSAFLLKMLLPCCICSDPLARPSSSEKIDSDLDSMNIVIGSCGHLAHADCCLSLQDISQTDAQKIVNECAQAAARRSSGSFDVDSISVLRCPTCGPVATRKLFTPPFTPEFVRSAIHSSGELYRGEDKAEVVQMCASLSASDAEDGWAGVKTELKAFDAGVAAHPVRFLGFSEESAMDVEDLRSVSRVEPNGEGLWRAVVAGDGDAVQRVCGADLDRLRDRDDGAVLLMHQPAHFSEKKNAKTAAAAIKAESGKTESGKTESGNMDASTLNSGTVVSQAYTHALLLPVRDDDEAFAASATDMNRSVTVASQTFYVTPSSVPFELEPLTPLHYRLGCMVLHAECVQTENDMLTVDEMQSQLEKDIAAAAQEQTTLEKRKISAEHDLLTVNASVHETEASYREAQNKVRNMPSCNSALQLPLVRLGVEAGHMVRAMVLRTDECLYRHEGDEPIGVNTKAEGRPSTTKSRSKSKFRATSSRTSRNLLENTDNVAQLASISAAALWSATVAPDIPAIAPNAPPSHWHRLVSSAGPVVKEMGGVSVVPRAAAWLACAAMAAEEEVKAVDASGVSAKAEVADIASPFEAKRETGRVASLAQRSKQSGVEAARNVVNTAHRVFAPVCGSDDPQDLHLTVERDGLCLVRDIDNSRVILGLRLCDSGASAVSEELSVKAPAECTIDTLGMFMASNGVPVDTLLTRDTSNNGVFMEFNPDSDVAKKGSVSLVADKLESVPINAACAYIRTLEEEFMGKIQKHMTLMSRLSAFEKDTTEIENLKRSKEQAQREAKRRKLASQISETEKDIKLNQIAADELDARCEEAKQACIRTLLDTVAGSKEECEALLAKLRRGRDVNGKVNIGGQKHLAGHSTGNHPNGTVESRNLGGSSGSSELAVLPDILSGPVSRVTVLPNTSRSIAAVAKSVPAAAAAAPIVSATLPMQSLHGGSTNPFGNHVVGAGKPKIPGIGGAIGSGLRNTGAGSLGGGLKAAANSFIQSETKRKR